VDEGNNSGKEDQQHATSDEDHERFGHGSPPDSS
jgi:hypothetical protein